MKNIQDKAKSVGEEPKNIISVGITWVDGRAVFKEHTKHSFGYYGICHFSKSVFAVTTLDYKKPTMMTQIMVAPVDGFCEQQFTCLCFHCPLNRFDKNIYATEFKDSGLFSLGMPQSIGDVPLWFSVGKWKDFWEKFIIGVDGGTIKYQEESE